MTTFVLLALLMVVITLALLLPGFWRIPKADISDRTGQNISIIKEQLAVLETSLATGEVTQEQYQQARDELEASLLQDTTEEEINVDLKMMQLHGRWIAVMLGFILPVFIIAGYALLGTPKVFDKEQNQVQALAPHAEGNKNMPSLDVMLARLEQKLIDQPDNLDSWMMAGRSYMSLKRYADAKRVLQKAYALASDNPAVMLRYADAITMSRGGSISGEAFALIKKALVKEPHNIMGLWMAGLAYEEQADYKKAITYWQKLEPLLTENPESLAKVRDLIAQGEFRLGGAVETVEKQKLAPASIKVTIQLAPELKASVNENDTVFIFARAAEGPPMPLAVIRKQVKDLPLTVRLDDSIAMMSSMKISNFPQISINARISRSGQAALSRGDLKALPVLTNSDSRVAVELVIDQIVD